MKTLALVLLGLSITVYSFAYTSVTQSGSTYVINDSDSGTTICSYSGSTLVCN